jgi:hypothetical protein
MQVGQVEGNTVLFLVFQMKDLQWKALPVASHSQRAINQNHLISPLYLSHKEMTRLETWAPATTPALTNFCYNILPNASFQNLCFQAIRRLKCFSEIIFLAGMYCSVRWNHQFERMNIKVAGWITCPFGFLVGLGGKAGHGYSMISLLVLTSVLSVLVLTSGWVGMKGDRQSRVNCLEETSKCS